MMSRARQALLGLRAGNYQSRLEREPSRRRPTLGSSCSRAWDHSLAPRTPGRI